MKSAGILIVFVPLIVYGVLAGSSVASVTVALAAALIVAIITGFSNLKKGMILTWATVVLFGALFVAVGILHITVILPFMGILIYAALAAVTFGSILAKKPFTLQYAREMVDRKLWENPVFIRVNVLMTGIWGGVFVINLLLNYFMLVMPEPQSRIAQLLTYIVIVAGIIFTIWYPKYLLRKPFSTSGRSGT